MAGLAPSPLPPSPVPPTPAPPAAAEEHSLDLWYVGAIINVVGSVSINLGMNLMKLGHTRRAALEGPEEAKPPIRKFRIWVIGISIFITGNVLNFVSFAFAAQSLLAALGSLQLVCNVVFAYFVNHEPVTKLVIFCTLCIIGGCVLLVVFGNQSSETYTVQQLIDLYSEPAYVVYLVMMGVFVFGFYIAYLHSKRVCRKRALWGGFWYMAQLVSYSIFSALLGSQSVLFGKSISVILRTTFEGDNQLGNWYTWVVLPVFTFAALFWVTRLNKGLRMFPAMIIVPLMQIAWTLFSIVSGMLYFQEYKGFTTLKAIMFPVGVLVVFFGVFLLTIGNNGPPPVEACPAALEKAMLESASATGAAGSGGGGGGGGGGGPMTVHENAAFARHEGDARSSEVALGSHPKLSMAQSLRLMSTWAPASVAASPASVVGRGTLRRGTELLSPSDGLNATGRSGRTEEGTAEHPPWSARSFDPNSTLNKTAASATSHVSETPSMMGTMRKGLKSVHNRLTSDLGLETKAGLKLAMGFGDGGLTGVSLFAMPALDFTATAKRTSRTGGAATDAAILNALPRSRFYKVEGEGLTPIRELPTTKVTSSELGASLTASSRLAGSSSPSRQGGGGPPSALPSPSPSPPTGHSSPDTRPASVRGDAASTRPSAGGAAAPPPAPSNSGQAAKGPLQQVQRQQPQRPHDEAALLGMLPGPSFRPPVAPGEAGEAGASTPTATAAAPAGMGFRARRPSGAQEPPPASRQGFAPGPSPAPGPPPTRAQVLDSETSAWAQQPRPAGGSGGVQDAAPGPPGPSSGGRHMPRPGSLAALPEGVPLSTANSVILHESRPSTPPEVMLSGGGASGGYPYSGPRTASPLQSPPLAQYQQYYQQYYQQAYPQHYQQQTQQQPQYGQATVPLALLQRAQAPPLAGGRLPPLHLMVPGMAPAQAPMLAMAMGQPGFGGGVPGGGGGGLGQYPSVSASYAQLLTGQMTQEAGVLMGPSLGPSHGAMMGPGLQASQVGQLAGPLAGGGSPPARVMQPGRQFSPSRGLSVSRSWAGLGSMGGGGAAAASRLSPLRGSYIAHMQKPLRPWQY